MTHSKNLIHAILWIRTQFNTHRAPIEQVVTAAGLDVQNRHTPAGAATDLEDIDNDTV